MNSISIGSKHPSPRQALRSLALALVILLTTIQYSSPVHAESVNDSITTTCTSVVSLEPGNAALESSSPSPSFSTLTTSALPFPSFFQPIQFQTVDDVPRNYFDTHQSIYALVERVIDGDTLRVRHIPGYRPWWFRSQTPQPLQKRGIADETLSIRIYGVDCPEIGKNKRETSQPFAEQAKDFTSDLVLHQMVKITFLRRDQYRRAVAVVETVPSSPSALFCSWIPGRAPKDLSVELARRGLAELYTGGGAEYNVGIRYPASAALFHDLVCANSKLACVSFHSLLYFGTFLPPINQNNRKLLEDKIALAKRERRGVWSQGEQRISAAEYKRQKNQQEAAEEQGASQMGAPAVAAGHRALTGLQA